MERLTTVSSAADIPPQYRNTPVGLLLEYHNLGRPFEAYSSAKLLMGMCMDNRHQLRMPNNFSFILRTGGANLRRHEFKVSFAIGVGGVRCMALMGHTECGMVNLAVRKEQFIRGLVEAAGWERKSAEEHFDEFAPQFEIGNEIDFTLDEVRRLRSRYPKITIAPLLYRVQDNLIYIIREEPRTTPSP
jgi:carbonic anhydrase